MQTVEQALSLGDAFQRQIAPALMRTEIDYTHHGHKLRFSQGKKAQFVTGGIISGTGPVPGHSDWKNVDDRARSQ